MERIKFPGWEAKQKSVKKQAAEKARLAAEREAQKEAEKQQIAQKRDYMRGKTKGMPLFSKEYLDGEYDDWLCMVTMGYVGMGVLLGFAARLISDHPQDWTSLNPMHNILVLPIAIPLMGVLYVLAKMLENRSRVIYGKNICLDSYTKTENKDKSKTVTPDFDAIFAGTWEFMRNQEMDANSFCDISCSLLKNRVSGDRRYFDKLITMPEKPTTRERDMKIAETIIVTHLKKHPEDAPRVLEVFAPETLPASIQKYIPKTR